MSSATRRASDDAIHSLVISYKLLGTREGDCVDWLTIKDLAASVADDVRRVRSYPLVPKTIPIYGCIYDVKTGRLNEVPEATGIGKARSRPSLSAPRRGAIHRALLSASRATGA